MDQRLEAMPGRHPGIWPGQVFPAIYPGFVSTMIPKNPKLLINVASLFVPPHKLEQRYAGDTFLDLLHSADAHGHGDP